MTTATPTNLTIAPPHEFVHGPADLAKLISAFILFLIVMAATYFPAVCVRRTRRGRQMDEVGELNYIPSLPTAGNRLSRRRLLLYISCFNCFSGGVFLATGMLDVFPDAQTDVAVGLHAYGTDHLLFPLAAFCLLIGFFLLLIIEQIVACYSHRVTSNETHSEERESLVNQSLESTDYVSSNHSVSIRGRRSVSLTASLDGIHPPHPRRRPSGEDAMVFHHQSETDEIHDHFVETMRSGNPIRSFFLVGAMSVHSLFEGLALGLETSPKLIYQLLGAISLHKLILALGIGVSLGQAYTIRRCILTICSLIFAIMSPFGVVLGMALTYVAHAGSGGGGAKKFKLISGLLQAMACGTFLFVTFFEILPREINAATRPFKRTIFMVSLLTGFLCMSLFVYFL